MISKRFTDFLARLRRGPQGRERARLAAILELNRALAKADDRRGLLRLLLDEAIELFSAERGFVVIADDGDRPGFRVEAARSHDRESVKNPARKVSSTVIRQCLERREGVFVEDAQTGDLGAASSVADLKLRSVLCMPLVARDRCIGCLYVDHRFRSGAFAADDLPWFEAFADQAAIALHLHSLLELVREHSREVERENQQLAATVAEQAQELTVQRDDLTRDRLAHAYPEILGESNAVLRHLRLLDTVIAGDFPVLLVGESGTGKELAARAIHRHGRRKSGPFVPIEIAAISPQLVESELFGHVKGAFTGAERDRVGLLREANGGVLFLDEVTEMPLEVQVKLLRFLEERTVRPVGGDATHPVDVRVVAATNRSPEREVQAGRFRADLYYRLAVVTVPVPPLRERRADIPMLVEHFLRASAASAGRAEARTASPELLLKLERRAWHGNLRELRNEVQRLDALATGATIGVESLGPEGPASAAPATVDLGELERRAVVEALRMAEGNKSEAARLLGISRRALYNKLGRWPRSLWERA